ncbi:hypothetical protein BV898_09676 [Hypsibius exemplaris]|uniref:Chitin-binding type-2 domain-containing protein n=1 Tax=Hypsibius exemplaris TaxID=2072580 RepID=A0A1W0WLY9_HYPEX|nr:hypothetical protein BV898_09676 [Hypsibius exemplaris]
MSQTAIFLAAFVVGVLALMTASSDAAPNAAPIALGYNYTLCRGQNRTHPVKGACNQFLICQNNYVYRDSCLSPLLYNERNGMCDYAWNVNCNRTAPMKTAQVQRTGLAAGQVPAAKSVAARFPGQESPVNNCHPSEMVQCFREPCQDEVCKGNRAASCHSDYCGGCFAKWFTIQVIGGRPTHVPAVCRD